MRANSWILLARLTIVLALSWATASSVQADLIKNISTGFDNPSSTLLPNGTPDTDYVIGPGGTGGHIGETPLVRTTPIPGTWLPDSASTASRWLALPGTGLEGISVNPGTFFFRTVVDLAGFNTASAQITGLRYAADNKLIAVNINGTAVFSQDQTFAEEFGSFHDLGNLGLGLFHTGENVVEFDVLNQLGLSTPMGLRVEGRVEGQRLASTPEPAAFVLLGLGAISLLCRQRGCL